MRENVRAVLMCGALVGLLTAAVPAQAISVPVDGGWVSFTFDSNVTGGPWTFTAGAGGVTLTVLDRYVYGERWDVFDDSSYVGTTSVAPLGGGNCQGAVDPCFNDPNTSKGFFDLGPGAHSITLQQIAGGSTSGSLRVDSLPVPEPASAALLALGSLGLGLARRRPRP